MELVLLVQAKQIKRLNKVKRLPVKLAQWLLQYKHVLMLRCKQLTILLIKRKRKALKQHKTLLR